MAIRRQPDGCINAEATHSCRWWRPVHIRVVPSSWSCARYVMRRAAWQRGHVAV